MTSCAADIEHEQENADAKDGTETTGTAAMARFAAVARMMHGKEVQDARGAHDTADERERGVIGEAADEDMHKGHF